MDRETGKVLMEEQRSTFAHGFVGLWLSRDMYATLAIASRAGRSNVDISITADAPPCLTALELT